MVSRHIGAGLGGAASGAIAGSAFGPIGAGVGGAVGGLGGYFGSKGGAFQTKEKESLFDKYTPEQKDLIGQLMGALTGQGGGPTGGLLGEMFGEGGFDAYADPSKRFFQEQIAPGIAQKYASTGGASLVNSSAFQQQLARAGEDLSAKLGEFRGQQQQGQLGALLNALLGGQFERDFQPSGPSGLTKGLASLAGGLGTGLSQGLGSRIASNFGRGGGGIPDASSFDPSTGQTTGSIFRR